MKFQCSLCNALFVNEDDAQAHVCASSAITRPSHYVDGRSIEPIDVIEDWKLDYHIGTVLKYISRAGRKDDEIKDLLKARWFLNRKLNLLGWKD